MKQKKLVLKKEIISNLSDYEMDKVKGGKIATLGACETEPVGPIRCATDNKCNTADHCV